METLLQQGVVKSTMFLAYSLRRARVFLISGESRSGFRSWAKGWHKWFAHPFSGVCIGHVFLFPIPCSQLFRSGSWDFWSLCILSVICPNWMCRQLFLIPYSFFILCGFCVPFKNSAKSAVTVIFPCAFFLKFYSFSSYM